MEKQKKKNYEIILQKVKMYKANKNVEKCKKKKDLREEQSQNKNPSYDNK